MDKTPVISVVICTHNRASLLCGAVQSVLEQEYPTENYELIIVDNNSTDSTCAVMQEVVSQQAHVRYVLETNLGLSNARNRGWKEAKGEYVGYLDDDCLAPSGWLSNAFRVATKIHPEAFGGPYYAFYNTPKPAWFKDQYGSRVAGAVARPLNEKEYLSGGNMFIRHDVLQGLGGFHSELGMKGNKIAFGEETYLLKRLRAKANDSVLYYDPSVFVYHLVRPEKFDIRTAPKRFFLSGVYSRRIRAGQSPASILHLLFLLTLTWLNIVRSFMWGLFARDKNQYPYIQNHLYEETFPYFAQLGAYAESLRKSIKRS